MNSRIVRWCVLGLVATGAAATAGCSGGYDQPVVVTQSSNGQTIGLSVNQDLFITIPGTPGAGDNWVLASLTGTSLKYGGSTTTTANPSVIGGTANFNFFFEGLSPGTAVITLQNQFRGGPPTATYTLTVNVSAF